MVVSLVLAAAGTDWCADDGQNSPLCKRTYRKVWWRNLVVLACEPLSWHGWSAQNISANLRLVLLLKCVITLLAIGLPGTDTGYLPEEV